MSAPCGLNDSIGLLATSNCKAGSSSWHLVYRRIVRDVREVWPVWSLAEGSRSRMPEQADQGLDGGDHLDMGLK